VAGPGENAEEVVVVGAGAAGLWAAARAAELGAAVTLLEKTPRAGTKVLASGGTRCNLTTTLGPQEAGRLFGPEGARFLAPALGSLSPEALRLVFAGLGVETVEAPLEKVFPRSGRARDVRNALQDWATGAGARIRLNAPVRGVEPAGEGWRVRLEDGEHVDCARLLLAPGGKSYPRTGTTGDGYAWLAALGLELVEPVPALVPLTSPEPWVRALSGVHLQEARVRLLDEHGTVLGLRERPVVFTHRGISGPGAMDLSEHVARARGRTLALVLDGYPEVEREELRARLIEAAGAPGGKRLAATLAACLPRPLPRRLLAAISAQAGLAEENPRTSSLNRSSRHELIEALKGLHVPVAGTRGFDHAEVTAGGLALSEVDPGSMRVDGRPGLFVFGEVLDLQGPIGGLNFQAAFATAELAARAAARG
jgi:predicted Rossmann fold flavoprotein